MPENPWVDSRPASIPAGWTVPTAPPAVEKDLHPAGESPQPQEEPLKPLPEISGPRGPQPGIAPPAEGLAVTARAETARLWVVGAHGGAGESTLAAMDEDWRAGEHAWPELPGGAPAVTVLVARTNVSGLLAAQRALTQWAASAAGRSAQCAALVLIADAPGKLPQPILDLIRHVSGGAPRVLRLGWVETWRLGDLKTRPPREVRQLVRQLHELSPAPAGETAQKGN